MRAGRAPRARGHTGRSIRRSSLRTPHPSLAPAHLDAWLAWASRSRLDPFVKLARTIRRHRAGILAASRLGLSNGRLEALNSRLRLMSHRSLGFHSPPPPHRTRLPLLRRRRHRAPAMNFTTE
jgi:Transposase